MATYVMSDLHGCYDEFVALLQQNNITVKDGYITDNKDDKLIAILGDYIDEGPQVEQCIDFC
ncbi:MAG: metallophosphoesterase, partial [Lachnospiraceae bacterium]|nr:metallophosphoesterase [Lachnospiraceae bacterium]